MKPDAITLSDLFECKMCGECCTGYGGTYVTEKNIAAIAAFIDTDSETFKKKYCQISGGRYVLSMSENDKCIFFDPVKQCTIHPVKPRMCREWPFLKNVIKSPENWEIMGGACPGIRTNIQPHDLIKCIREEIKKRDA